MAEHTILKTRRSYNRWVANQTLEDYALRFTAKKARRWSIGRVSNTALGAISFLALEAIGGTITIHYGFDNALLAIILVSTIIFFTGIPICYYAARYGVDIDLLSRGASFGYIGSTITSLIYASFTFIFFALEAAIMASALELLFGIPKSIGYLLCSLIIIPLVTHGITLISRFQLWSQPIWLTLQLLPFIFILWHEWTFLGEWTAHQAIDQPANDNKNFNLIFFGAASGILFSLMAQIGEQVDFLRFLPKPEAHQRKKWWIALLAAGPGWIIVGALKIIAGSFLAVLALHHGIDAEAASDPTNMYLIAFSYLNQSPNVTLALTGIFVIVCQLKINVTNAYAGSIAWSNFFSRLTHNHPGRVVWLVFNVMIALLLMELGVYNALERILGIYSNVAVAWVGALVADLVINKPLGLSPKHIEFKRAHLYDINPVGVGAMLFASTAGIVCYSGTLGEVARALSPYIALLSAFIASPLIAYLTKGKYYLARPNLISSSNMTSNDQPLKNLNDGNYEKNSFAEITKEENCTVCQNTFEIEDIALCPAYDGPICSLCCSLDSSCNDQCKQGAKFSEQVTAFAAFVLPKQFVGMVSPRILQFFGLLSLIIVILAVLFWMVFLQVPTNDIIVKSIISSTLTQIFLLLIIIVGVLTWLFVLANESRQMALQESIRQTSLLSKEILAHEKTDQELQQAKELAESANLAKSRYLTGISHELRSPLNSILGYAQLLNHDEDLNAEQSNRVNIIRRSGEHLADLIEGLLDISRIEAGRLEIHRDKVFIRELLDDLIEMFQLQADSKGIQFEYVLNGFIPNVVIADEKHLRQILINLLSNAVKFTHSGKVSLIVSYRSQIAEFIIKDTGIGIEQQKQDLIFKPFERIRNSEQQQIPGTGLGLTITKLLTEIMGGEITLSSTPNKGSTFKVTLMLSRVHEEEIKKTEVKKVISYIGPSKKILVVDDDSLHRGLISEILTPLGFVVYEASNGESCLKIMESTDFDLLFLDISMPGISGIDLAKKIKSEGCEIPIIMASADATEDHEGIKQNGKQKLYEHYLIKPIRDSLLLDAVASALKLEWQYGTTINSADNNENTSLNPPSEDKPFILEENDRREIISMAELGFAEGVSQILERIEKQANSSEYVKQMNNYLERFQFAEIIKVNSKSTHK